MRSLTQARNNLVSEPIMALPPSSNFDQRLDRLEARLGSVMHEMREFIASLNS